MRMRAFLTGKFTDLFQDLFIVDLRHQLLQAPDKELLSFREYDVDTIDKMSRENIIVYVMQRHLFREIKFYAPYLHSS